MRHTTKKPAEVILGLWGEKLLYANIIMLMQLTKPSKTGVPRNPIAFNTIEFILIGHMDARSNPKLKKDEHQK